ncbi:serine/threonine-protein kinase phg2-like [Cynara cardunculus var. scolymus]|uniref:serine/threonine-protein kinase phg2-like n=1 Tax=Cynara cardunculus var. scolymus TaxID=59895 RepID=UPI000D62B7F1|nr:serine/threonine-protein kinase phg2-like [Cynara cardunculus var. scolymus]
MIDKYCVDEGCVGEVVISKKSGRPKSRYVTVQKQQEEDNAEQKNSSPSSSSDQQFVHKEDHVEGTDSSSSSSLEKQCRRFSLAEIKLATHDFDDAFVIGKGGFGKVYKGTIDFGGGIDVAIKRLNIDSNQGATEFWAEIEMLSKLRHSHIVSLVGYHEESSKREMILVYEYLPNGSLEDHLHKRRANGGNFSPLTWIQRLRICIDAARGLDYLHTGTGVRCRVIHRDVKSSNILLDENLAGKIADFGLSRTGPAYQSCTTNVYTNQIRGTFGYMDAQYFATHRLTRKSDVYAFGVVLFEVLYGRPAVDFTLEEKQHSLAAWAKRCVEEGTIYQFVDPCLRGEISTRCLKEFTQIAYKCLLWSPKDRPTMTVVVAQIEFVLALALQKHDGVTVIEKVRSLFSKLPGKLEFLENYLCVEIDIISMVASVNVHSTFIFIALFISIMYFHLVSAVHTKNYRNRKNWSNANKNKLLILDKAVSTMAKGRSEGINNGVGLVDPTKAASEVSSKNINKGVTTEEPTMTLIGGSSVYVKAAAVPTEAECHRAAMMLKAQPLSSQIGTQNLKIFTFDELQRATRNFRPSAMLGFSDGESVYRGWVDRALYAPSVCGVRIAVAIRILNTDKVRSIEEWQAEVNRGKFSHPRLVKLLGYCSEDGRLLLVHEYIPKRNLVELLNYHPLQWATALKIAIGAAQGLAFLHTAENTPIYRTFDASNILLNEDFEAELYFGLATLGSPRGIMTMLNSDMLISHHTTPEYMATGHWCFKSDVYAFGVMMLHMIAGSSFFMDNRWPSLQSFMECAEPILSDPTKLERIMDPWSERGNPPKGASEAAELILNCLKIDPENRPSMTQVVASLEGINSMDM